MNTGNHRTKGYTLIEVLVGIVIFAIGMMALAQLQGQLSKASADATRRTVATNIAEEEIERLRSFRQIPDTGGTVASFEAIRSSDPASNPPVVRGNTPYTVDTVVTDFYYNPATEKFQDFKPDPDIVYPDLKRVELTVAWGAGNDSAFRIDDTQTSDLGSGSITLVDLISSITTGSGAKVQLNNAATGLYSPPVDYNPGQNPDIVSINLGDNKFKESTTPLPDVIRTDELVETSFDVVTYSNPNDGSGATFLRREEFRSVSCECTLRIPASATEGGLRPTVWNGSEYEEGEFVSKPYGESANNQQSNLCGLCCRDHHDGGVGLNDLGYDPGVSQYGPFRASTDYHGSGALAGNHKHYNRDRNGNPVLVDTDGGTYVEACRLIRKDGFFRVAQDLRQEGLNAFPADYLDEAAEVAEYSDYVTGAVSLFEAGMNETGTYSTLLPSPSEMIPEVVFPASTPANATVMSAGGVEQQQLRSRGIYVDYMSSDLRQKINCLETGGSGESCGVPRVSSPLEVIPFYDVQLTWLSRWNELPTNYPIDVSNEAIADGNTHSRGLAALTTGTANSTISSTVHSGNLGLTGTDPIDPNYVSDLERYNLYAKALEFNTPPTMSGVRISGTISSAVGGVKASDVVIEATDAACDRTSLGFDCLLEDGASNPWLTVTNYYKFGKDLYACSVVLTVHGQEHSGDTPDLNWTRFNLPTVNTLSADIVIREGGC